MVIVASKSKSSPRPKRMWFYVFVYISLVGVALHFAFGMHHHSDSGAFLATDIIQQPPLPFRQNIGSDSDIADFEKQDGVVIVTKVHGDALAMKELQQSLCLFKMTYNGRMNYDHVIFTTIPMPENYVNFIKVLVAPAKLRVVVDSMPIQDEIAKLSDAQRTKFLNRCNATDISEITWNTICRENLKAEDGKLSYNWMSEFRTKYFWTHPALAQYKYAMWVDADAFATRVWDKDPVATMIRNDLVILFDNFPSGRIYDDGLTIPTRIRSVFNTSICSIELVDGHLKATTASPPSECREQKDLENIHGFFHVTNLDFFRDEPYQKWAKALVGDEKYRLQFNDEVAITVAVALLAPERSWDMQSHGLRMKVMHNGKYDGNEHYTKSKEKVMVQGKLRSRNSFLPWWKLSAAKEFPEAWRVCRPLVTASG